MITTADQLSGIVRQRLIAIVRTTDDETLVRVADDLVAAGMTTIEITLTSPGALRAIESLRSRSADIRVGVGTVLTAKQADEATRAGAEFVISPILDRSVIAAAQAVGVPAIPGVNTPTELYDAIRAGADAVKVFPAAQLGPSWLRAVLDLQPGIPIIPTGGITPNSVPEWLYAGAAACGLGSALSRGTREEISRRVSDLLANVPPAP